MAGAWAGKISGGPKVSKNGLRCLGRAFMNGACYARV